MEYEGCTKNPYSNPLYTKIAKYELDLVKQRDIFFQPLTSPEETLSESENEEIESTEQTLKDYEVIQEASLTPQDKQKKRTEESQYISPSNTQQREDGYDADNESETTESEKAASEHEETSYFWSGISALAKAFRAWTFSGR